MPKTITSKSYTACHMLSRNHEKEQQSIKYKT